MKMELEFDVKMDAATLYDYMMRHSYNSPSGLIGTGVGALLVWSFFVGRGFLYLILGVVLMLYLPCSLYLRAQKQAKSPIFQKVLHYKLSDAGVEVSQDEDKAVTEWQGMYRAVSTGRSIILYTTRVNAFIFPRKSLGEKLPALVEIISTHLPPERVKIRY